MNNPPFSIGQKVVALETTVLLIKDNIYTVIDIEKGCCQWRIYVGCNIPYDFSGSVYCTGCNRHYYVGAGNPLFINAKMFVPIITNYSDATTEILEKFKSPAETPDKILTPEKVTNQ